MLCCTLTGASDDTDPADLVPIARAFPFVEWGILFSYDRSGSGRYPSRRWIKAFSTTCARAGMQSSVHLCGSAVWDLLNDSYDLELLCSRFDRVQLNFDCRRRQVPLARLEALIRRMHIPVITQHNANNSAISLDVTSWRHEVLFDASGGQGVRPPQWPRALMKRACGYAGGLGPDNIAAELPRIQEAAAGRPYWIDMESGIRDARDRFDLSAVRKVLGTVEPVVYPEGLEVSRCA